jgi:type I restriction enzyme, R subunit
MRRRLWRRWSDRWIRAEWWRGSGVSEAQWETIALEALAEQDWRPLPGTAITPGAEGGRTSWTDIVLPGRTLAKVRELNPQVPGDYLAQALAEIIEPTSQDAIAENYRLSPTSTRLSQTSGSRLVAIV